MATVHRDPDEDTLTLERLRKSNQVDTRASTGCGRRLCAIIQM